MLVGTGTLGFGLVTANTYAVLTTIPILSTAFTWQRKDVHNLLIDQFLTAIEDDSASMEKTQYIEDLVIKQLLMSVVSERFPTFFEAIVQKINLIRTLQILVICVVCKKQSLTIIVINLFGIALYRLFIISNQNTKSH